MSSSSSLHKKLIRLCASNYSCDLVEVVKLANSKESICTLRDSLGWTPLHYLCNNPLVNEEVLKVILDAAPALRGEYA